MSQLSNRIAAAMINYANAFKETPENRVLAEKETLKETIADEGALEEFTNSVQLVVETNILKT